eukprot:13858635-Ditylum_brightwellii.AAC.1
MELEDPKKAQQRRRMPFCPSKGNTVHVASPDEFNFEKLDEVQKLFIQHCKLKPVNKVIGTKITKVQWKGKVAKWRENTTTSPLGRQLSHFKALIRNFAESPDTDEGQDMFQKKENIIDAH